MDNRTRRHRSIDTAAAAIALAMLATGCVNTTTTSNSAIRLEKISIVVGAVPAADSAGLYIAQQLGYFADEGVHVKIVPIVSAELAISAQLAGTYDVTLGNYVSYIEADAEQHARLRIIAEGSVMQPGNQAIVTLPTSRITTLAGLRGATLAVNVKNNVGTILIGSALEEHGLSLSDVKLIPIQFPFMAAALKDHKVDAAWVPEPFLSSAEEQLGAKSIFDLDQGSAQSFPVVGYAVTSSWEQKYPKTAAAFLSALEKGQATAESDRAAVERSIRAFLGVPAPTAAIAALPAFPLGVDRVRLQRVSDAMYRFGLLKQPFNVGQLTAQGHGS
ncbi:MAG TPA: ABC transporter substrate-binding protein [Streptosporangiaceae bacterium]